MTLDFPTVNCKTMQQGYSTKSMFKHKLNDYISIKPEYVDSLSYISLFHRMYHFQYPSKMNPLQPLVLLSTKSSVCNFAQKKAQCAFFSGLSNGAFAFSSLLRVISQVYQWAWKHLPFMLRSTELNSVGMSNTNYCYLLCRTMETFH